MQHCYWIEMESVRPREVHFESRSGSNSHFSSLRITPGDNTMRTCHTLSSLLTHSLISPPAPLRATLHQREVDGCERHIGVCEAARKDVRMPPGARAWRSNGGCERSYRIRIKAGEFLPLGAAFTPPPKRQPIPIRAEPKLQFSRSTSSGHVVNHYGADPSAPFRRRRLPPSAPLHHRHYGTAPLSGHDITSGVCIPAQGALLLQSVLPPHTAPFTRLIPPTTDLLK